jgi:hypothetical protein
VVPRSADVHARQTGHTSHPSDRLAGVYIRHHDHHTDHAHHTLAACLARTDERSDSFVHFNRGIIMHHGTSTAATDVSPGMKHWARNGVPSSVTQHTSLLAGAQTKRVGTTRNSASAALARSADSEVGPSRYDQRTIQRRTPPARERDQCERFTNAYADAVATIILHESM